MPASRAVTRPPIARNALKISVIVPAHNEERNVSRTLSALAEAFNGDGIPFELLVVNDNSRDDTMAVVLECARDIPQVRLVHNAGPNGLGRAIRCGLAHYTGDVVAIVMADSSDAPEDVVRCYRKIEEGFDCAFGSRFIDGSKVTAFPPVKLVANRIVNNLMRVLFMTRHNDLTNAFKVYRREVIDGISPLHAAHFNITIEMSLSALIRGYSIATLPISWSGRTWGQSNLRLREMGRRYLCTLLKIWFERLLIHDDVMMDAGAIEYEKDEARRAS
jgi:dolichol-phosphate mannosyltransferase